MTNYLKYINETENHPLKKILKINEDNTSIISSFTNKERIIYNTTNVALEDLGRELFSFMDKRLSLFKNNFEIEKTCYGSKKPADMVEAYGDYLNSILEFKSFSTLNKNNINNEVSKVFNQLKDNYIIPFIDNDFKKTEEVFASCVIIDVEKIIKQPDLIDKYYNSIDNIIKTEPKSSLKKYGVFVLTKKYLKSKRNFVSEDTFISHNIAISETFLYKIPKSPLEACNALTLFSRNAIDARNTITSSPSQTVGNIRELLDVIEDNGKKGLYFSILETIIKAKNDKDYYCLNKQSECKTFVLNKNATSVSIQDIEDDNYETTKKITFTSCDAALINGQQSTDIPGLIKFFLLYKGNDKEFLKMKEKTLKRLLDKDGRERNAPTDVQEFIDFMGKCYFNYVISLEDNQDTINSIAENKNYSIPIDRENNFFVKQAPRYKFLSNKISEHSKYLLTFPNCSKEFSDEKYMLPVSYISYIYETISKPGKTKKEKILSYIEGKKPPILNQKNLKTINSILNLKSLKKTSKFKRHETSLLESKKELENLKKTKQVYINDSFEEKEEAARSYIERKINDIDIKIKDTEKEINYKKEEVDTLRELQAEGYEFKHNYILPELIQSLDIWFQIKNKVEKINLQSKIEMNKKDNIISIILHFIINQYGGSKKILKLKKEELDTIIDNIIEGFINIKSNYNFVWTSINNGNLLKLENVICKKKTDDSSINIIDLFETIKY